MHVNRIKETRDNAVQWPTEPRQLTFLSLCVAWKRVRARSSVNLSWFLLACFCKLFIGIAATARTGSVGRRRRDATRLVVVTLNFRTCGHFAQRGSGLCRDAANSQFSLFTLVTESFWEDAVRKGHPRNLLARVPECAKGAIEDLLDQPMHLRFKRLPSELKRSLELKEEEATLHSQLPKHLERVLHGKKNCFCGRR